MTTDRLYFLVALSVFGMLYCFTIASFQIGTESWYGEAGAVGVMGTIAYAVLAPDSTGE